jgi:Icc protein
MLLLAHVSDTHFDDGERAARRSQQVMTFLEDMRGGPDVVLLTGDVADHGLPSEYAEAVALITASRHRVITCPGNHDERSAYREALLRQSASTEPVNEIHEVGALRVAMCDSSIPGRHDGLLSDETLSWLSDILDETPTTRPVVVAFHHPPVLLHNDFIDGIRQFGEQRLADVVSGRSNVVGLLCGHAHTPAASTFAGLPLLVAPGVVSTLRLPWETDQDIDESLPPAIAFHVIDDDWRITTHFRLVT